jgi:O-6-methylguanine DNA methyltransferase
VSSSKGVACAEGAAFSMVLTWPPGRILVAWDQGGVYAVRFLAPGEGAEMSGASEPPGGGLGPRIRDALARFQESGDWSGVAELPRKQSAASEFTSGVWAQISRIPCGSRQSYGEIAQALGRPGASRAVGRACGANPIPILVPCHRVVAADGGLGGFSGGLHWKRWLLEREA